MRVSILVSAFAFACSVITFKNKTYQKNTYIKNSILCDNYIVVSDIHFLSDMYLGQVKELSVRLPAARPCVPAASACVRSCVCACVRACVSAWIGHSVRHCLLFWVAMLLDLLLSSLKRAKTIIGRI